MFRLVVIATLAIAVYGEDILKMDTANMMKAKDEFCKHVITEPDEKAYKCLVDKVKDVSSMVKKIPNC